MRETDVADNEEWTDTLRYEELAHRKRIIDCTEVQTVAVALGIKHCSGGKLIFLI